MKKLLLLLLALLPSSALASVTIPLDAGRLRQNAANPLPPGSLLLLVAAGGDGVFSQIAAGSYVSGNDILLAAQAFNMNGGPDETLNTFVFNIPANETFPNDRIALEWFPGITLAQYQAGAVPTAGQFYGNYNPRTQVLTPGVPPNPANTTDNPDGGSPWVLPTDGTTLFNPINFFTTDSQFGGTQFPNEGYAVIPVLVPEPSTYVFLGLGLGGLCCWSVMRGRVRRV